MIRKPAPSPVLFVTVILAVQILSLIPAEPLHAAIADDIRAQSYILMDADTAQVLLEKDMHSRRKPASITKILTAFLALEYGKADDPVTVSEAAVAAVPEDGSSAGLMPGEIFPLEEILYAVMLESANEAANAVAEYVSGSMDAFAAYMTGQAAGLGARNTNFSNANGLNDDLHYTSAYDMALITRAAIGNPRFQTIWNTYQHFLEPTNLQTERRILNNNNRMLSQSTLPYPGILGGKTGYTSASLNTLVEAASRDGRTLICVLLQGPGAAANFEDAARLLDYGFDAFRTVNYADDEYTASYTYLLHNDLAPEQVSAAYGSPRENPDGSTSVSVSFSVPAESGGLMHPQIADVTLTSPVPPPDPDLEQGSGGLFGQLMRLPPFSWLTGALSALFSMLSALFGGLISLIDLLPGWAALIVKALLSVFAALFCLACFFRTRRRIRRLKRLRDKRRMEVRKRAYREQQSYWN